MQVMVEVKVNMSPMLVRIGGIHCLYCKYFPPMTHLDAEIIPSIPIVKANGEMVHPAIHCTVLSMVVMMCILLF